MLLKSLAKASNWRIFWTKISRFYIFPQVRTSLAWYLTARSTPTTLATLVGGGVAGGVEKRAKPVSQTCQKLREGEAGGQDQEASDEGKFGLTQLSLRISFFVIDSAVLFFNVRNLGLEPYLKITVRFIKRNWETFNETRRSPPVQRFSNFLQFFGLLLLSTTAISTNGLK